MLFQCSFHVAERVLARAQGTKARRCEMYGGWKRNCSSAVCAQFVHTMGSDDEELAELRAQRASRMGGSAGLVSTCRACPALHAPS